MRNRLNPADDKSGAQQLYFIFSAFLPQQLHSQNRIVNHVTDVEEEPSLPLPSGGHHQVLQHGLSFLPMGVYPAVRQAPCTAWRRSVEEVTHGYVICLNLPPLILGTCVLYYMN